MLNKKSHLMLSAVFAMVFLFGVCLNALAAGTIKVNHSNTKENIISVIKKYPHSAFKSKITRYAKEPKFTAPYSSGSLNSDDLDDALNAVKVVRFLAGVPYKDVTFNSELNNIAQHGAVLLASSGQFTHYPTKPADMSQSFFDLAYKGCSSSNIFWGRDNISSAVTGFVYDNGQNNISRVGHRRWILKPSTEAFGMGYANSKINMYVFGNGSSAQFDSYVAWPPAGYFPIEYFADSMNVPNTIAAPWSVNLGTEYQVPSKQNISIKLTRARDNKVWRFDKNTPDLGVGTITDTKLHLAVDNDGYGMGKAIVFRPDTKSLGKIKDGDVFDVEIRGLKYSGGRGSATLKYSVKFFNIAKTLYAEDGRTKNVYTWEVGDYKKVGWYEEPFVRLYAEGKSKLYPQSKVDAQLKVGWYTEPVRRLYAKDGRSKLFPESKVYAQLGVGWYLYPVTLTHSINVGK